MNNKRTVEKLNNVIIELEILQNAKTIDKEMLRICIDTLCEIIQEFEKF